MKMSNINNNKLTKHFTYTHTHAHTAQCQEQYTKTTAAGDTT